ncbi:hypothetical protein [Mammaliicoccus sp. Dog046]|uniref:hypothetical protein n=1 Tax=Mammaliicoccus sp. Dog046 TaxID=3034233 RepID=UPI002B256624|nr:hypothetical protein [Mammaliicoccus sp. Dog046]WQK85866.1 hypothetical protein P3U32_02215 [Mammaliicoccus sp. Dog046]
MFNFHFDYFRNGRGNHLRTILLSFFAMFVFALALLIPGIFLLIGTGIYNYTLDFYGNPSTGGTITLIICAALSLITSLVIYIFVFIPLCYGYMTFYKNTDLGNRPHFRDLFTFLKKGQYVKTLKITAVIALMSIVGYIAVYIVFFVAYLIFIAVFGTTLAIMGPESENLSTPAAITSAVVIFLFLLVVMFVIYIPIYYLIILLINVTLVHIDQSSLPSFKKVSIAWNITTKGPNSAWKLLFANLLYYIGLYIIIVVIVLISVLISTLIFTHLPTFIGVIISIIFYIIYMIVITILTYLIYGSVVNFYHKNKNALYPTNNSAPVESNE